MTTERDCCGTLPGSPHRNTCIEDEARSPATADWPHCPFCGGTNLVPNLWCLEDCEVDAVECSDCYAGAPVDAWIKRA